jgi:hypothetical protein
MQRANALILAGLFAALIVGLGGLMLAKGGLYLAKHEGDTLHLADMVLRMAEAGQWPHLDFMTPIGVLAIAPIAAFVWLGSGLGHAVIWAQVLVALVLLLPLVRAMASRFDGVVAAALGSYVVVLCLALVHGEAQPAVSLSMHYNRWAWAIVYVVVPLAVLADRGRRHPWLDGALIGLGMAALALIKVTYFAAFAPAVLMVLVLRGQGRMLLAGLLAGLVVVAGLTALAGPAFWQAYLGDLLAVSRSEIRAQPGLSLASVIAAPAYFGGSLAALATVVFLRQSGRTSEGLALLLLLPGFFYVTWQNYGNDPQWLVLLAAVALSLRPDAYARNVLGWPMRSALTLLGVVALAFATPSLINLALSPLRQVFASTEGMVPLLPGRPAHADVLVQQARLYGARASVTLDAPGAPYAAYRDRAGELPEPAVLNGETLAECELLGGYNTWFEATAADLAAAGLNGRSIFIADLFSTLWLYGDFPPLQGGAPWLYGGTPGIAAADYVLVPLCPTNVASRSAALKGLVEAGPALTEVQRNARFILLRPVRP